MDCEHNIVIHSFEEAERDLMFLDDSWSVISIGGPGDDPPEGYEDDNPNHLRLEFHDIGLLPWQIESGDYVPPTKDVVTKLLIAADYLLRSQPNIYVHCWAGIGRSSAVAYILRCHLMGPGNEEEALSPILRNKRHLPNHYLTELADDVMSREGQMVAQLDEHLGDRYEAVKERLIKKFGESP